jgi:hypothetical protein
LILSFAGVWIYNANYFIYLCFRVTSWRLVARLNFAFATSPPLNKREMPTHSVLKKNRIHNPTLIIDTDCFGVVRRIPSTRHKIS